MISKDTLITVINKDRGSVGYTIPEMGVHRNFYANERKEIPFEELERLSYLPGGEIALKELLEIENEEAYKQLFFADSEPEYHYSREDVKDLMLNGTMDQFLDCLDFAPEVVIETVKDLAVELPLNDMAKREVILEKLNFDVTGAIEIRNTKFDGETEEEESDTQQRRTSVRKAVAPAPTGRRYKPETK